MTIQVHSIQINGGPIAQGQGRTLGRRSRQVDFVGEPRMLQDIGEEIARTNKPVRVHIETWQIVG